MEELILILKKGQASFPKLLLNNYKRLEISEKELILLIYLINEQEVYNPKKIAIELDIEESEVMELTSSLSNKDFLTFKVKKVNNIRNEYIVFDGLYEKLAFIVMNKEQKKHDNNLFDLFEKEFSRPLSPTEYELLIAWQNDSNYNTEIIGLALKESVYNGVFSFRYIDKILNEWSKKGIKNSQDLIDSKKINTNKIKEEKLVDYDWLNDNQ
jgi:DNA replication protein